MKQILEYIFTDRLKSYFYRTFIVTWLIINWKIVLAIFGFGLLTPCIKDKGLIYAVEFYADNSWNLIFFPLISTFVLIWLLPRIDLEIAKYKERDMKTKYIKEVTQNVGSTFTGKDIERKDKELAEMELKSAKAEAKATEYETKYSEENTKFIIYKEEHQYHKNWKKKPFDIFSRDRYDYEIKYKDYNKLLEKGTLVFADNNSSIIFKPEYPENTKNTYTPIILLFKYIENKMWFTLFQRDRRNDLELISETDTEPQTYTIVLDDITLQGTITYYNFLGEKKETDEYSIKLTKKL